MATRRKRIIEIEFDDDNNVVRINIDAVIGWADGAFSGDEPRPYSFEYEGLASGPQSRIDAFVTDVDTYLNLVEPLS
jgi:hypothetical protein